jgi:hypothetical protein
MTELISDDREIPNPDQQLADLTLRLRNLFVDRQMTALTQRLSQPETNESEHVELMREQQQWRTIQAPTARPALAKRKQNGAS